MRRSCLAWFVVGIGPRWRKKASPQRSLPQSLLRDAGRQVGRQAAGSQTLRLTNAAMRWLTSRDCVTHGVASRHTNMEPRHERRTLALGSKQGCSGPPDTVSRPWISNVSQRLARARCPGYVGLHRPLQPNASAHPCTHPVPWNTLSDACGAAHTTSTSSPLTNTASRGKPPCIGRPAQAPPSHAGSPYARSGTVEVLLPSFLGRASHRLLPCVLRRARPAHVGSRPALLL